MVITERHILSLPSAFSVVLVWIMGENASKKYGFSDQNALV